MFRTLKNGYLPLDENNSKKLPYHLGFEAEIDVNGKIPEKWIIPNELLPGGMRGVMNELHEKARAISSRFIKLVRWTQRASGKQNPFAFIDDSWSENGIDWDNLPSEFSVMAASPKPMNTADAELELARIAWNGQLEEPLGHEMLREAIDLSGQNPRSSLLMTVSALECGIKEYIASVAPDTSPLLDKIASPPVLTLLQEVVPELTIPLDMKYFPMIREDFELARKWVLLRNQTAHGVRTNIDVRDLGNFQAFTRRLLYKLDAQRNLGWAVKFAEMNDDDDIFH